MNKTIRQCWATYTFTFALALILPLLPITVASAATYYVATTGNNANSCPAATSITSPKRTIAAGIACMIAGDTLRIRGGTYGETLSGFPSGSSWANAPVIQAYPGETVTITQSSAPWAFISLDGGVHHVIIKDLILDGQGTAANGVTSGGQGSANFIRLEALEIKRFWNQGIFFLGSNWEILNCDIHDIGLSMMDNQRHGIYGADRSLIEGNRVHHNSGFGIQIYNGSYPSQPTNNNVIRANRVYDNGLGGGGGMTIGGDGNLVYNNLVYQNKADGVDIQYGSPSNTKFLNNTMWSNAGSGVYNSGSGTILANNIAYQNTGTQIVAGSATVQNNLTTNPGFISAISGNFQLLTGSAAINKGITRPEVTVDMTGVSRPQGGAYDIGAYEFSIVDGVPPAPPKGLKVN
jgi:hypothetical protein